MDKTKIEAIDLLDGILIGRVEPHIYAFTTNTVPNYLKIGDTFRPVSQRLNEWRVFFPDLEKKYENKATINEENYFRDYAIHQYMENDLHKKRLKIEDLEEGIYYSREFFKDVDKCDIENAIEDIKENYRVNSRKYDYYSSKNRLPQTFHYKRGEYWDLRPNQKSAVENFVKAIENGRKNLLMYAVMRFGKSFTALCCALEISANIVLVVSGKADVKDEWKKTVEGAGNFSEYVFLDDYDLKNCENIIKLNIENNKKIVIFLTLQDLQGDLIKDKHKELFKNKIDLLIVDETHFGARAESFGKILENSGYNKDDKLNIRRFANENFNVDVAEEKLKQINAEIRLHLSGTPYRILMGSEFEKEDIISFVQFSDIVKEQEEWDKNNLNKDDINEWDNPYYGFPQMIRFAFNPNKSSREKMESLKKDGYTFAFSKLFEPESIKKDTLNNRHKKFINEMEILDLLHVIDGSKDDENLLSFLDYDKIKEGKMCRHIVMVLPYCASCDSMEELLISQNKTFKNLNEYEILNISGVDAGKIFKNTSDIKTKIKECEELNKKTITLTVNRMLTGSTVEQWDTMLYFKDTSSPQEYDQSIFRLQNQYVRTLTNQNEIIKENLKPQTLLVDFDPERLFRMQEQKSLIYNVNSEENGNSKLKDRIEEELRISPIIMMNHNKIKEVDVTNILEAISEYNNQRSVTDEVWDIPVDLSILNDENIKRVIEMQAEFNSKKGLIVESNQGEGDDFDTSEVSDKKEGKKEKQDTKNCTEDKSDKERERLESKIKTYYQRILFFSFLTKDKVTSLDDIINVIDKEENIRLSRNLILDKEIVKKISKIMDPFKCSRLDYKIQNISMLASDESVSPLTRAMTSINKFNRMSESEVITPANVCDEMVALLPQEELKNIVSNKDKLLDIASKSGEYAVSLYKRLTSELGYSHNEIKDIIYSIPTSSIAYEFTRRFYEILDINIKNIAAGFNAYDLINLKNDKDEVDYERISSLIKQKKSFAEITLKDNIKVGEELVKFGAIVGNPPYQKTLIGTSDKQVYQEFMEIGYNLSKIAVFITPGKFLFNAGKTPKSWNRKMLNDKYLSVYKYEPDAKNIFPNIALSSSIVITIRNENNEVNPIIQFYPDEMVRNITNKVLNYKDFKPISDEIYLQSKFNTEILFKESPHLIEKIGSERRLITSILQKDLNIFFNEQKSNDFIKIYGNNDKGEFIFKYIDKKYIDNSQQNINNWKIVISATNGAAGNLGREKATIIGIPKLLENNSGFTQTFISIGNCNNVETAENLLKYFKTKFARFMVGTLKATQRLNKEVFNNVPIQDFTNNSNIDWTKTIQEIDEELFTKYGLSIEEKKYIDECIKSM